MKLLLILTIIALSLTGCSSLETVKTEANRTTRHYDMNYATLYRLVVKAERECEGTQRITSDIFPDIKEATVTRDQMMGMGMLHNFVMQTIEIKEIGPNKSQLDLYFFAGDGVRAQIMERLDRAILKGVKMC